MLVVVHEGVWTGERSQLEALQSKICNYLEFARGGQLEAVYPETAGKPRVIRVYADGVADYKTNALLEGLTEQAASEGVLLEIMPWPSG